MQAVEDFIHEFFKARIAEERRYQADRVPYRRQFFTSDCPWDSHENTLKMLQSEKVSSVEKSDLEAKVITVHANSFYPVDSQLQRRRYCLKATTDTWLISNVQIECPACGGQGDESCVFCKGEHWK